MRVLVAESWGMCFGVRDALALVEALPDGHGVAIHGELVHNPVVTARLAGRGFSGGGGPLAILPDAPTLVITAHGVSEQERARLVAAGKNLVDTTCPLVRRAHQAAQLLHDDGFFVLVIGRQHHAEVLGLVGDLTHFEIVEKAENIRTWPYPRLGIVSQTTTPPDEFARLVSAIRDANPHAEVCVRDTVCQPTKDRQEAVDQLFGHVDAMVVVGGRNSNNTQALVARGVIRGIPTFHVTAAHELRSSWFHGYNTIGLTAGTSTLPETVHEVRQALEALEDH